VNVVEITILLLAAVVLSSFADRLSGRRILLPFVQIMLGALLAGVRSVRIELEPDLFLLLFIAPILFLDGWRIPSERLLRDRWSICALALGLVLFTVAGAGYFSLAVRGDPCCRVSCRQPARGAVAAVGGKGPCASPARGGRLAVRGKPRRAACLRLLSRRRRRRDSPVAPSLRHRARPVAGSACAH